MKTYRSIWINERDVPRDVYSAIVQLKPDCQSRDFFHLEAKAGDEEGGQLVERIVNLCRKQGMKDKSEGHRDGAFTYTVLYHYEPSDLEAAPLLWIKTQIKMFKGINSAERDELGRIWLPAREAKPTIKIASIFTTPWIVVSNQARQILEAGEMKGLKFDEVTLRGQSVSPSAEPFWELRSSLTLPAMLNAVPDTGVSYESYLVQGTYGEPHYRQSDIQAVGSFDIAFTKEPLGGDPDPSLVVSQRFYQHCLKKGIPLKVLRPVRIDPD